MGGVKLFWMIQTASSEIYCSRKYKPCLPTKLFQSITTVSKRQNCCIYWNRTLVWVFSCKFAAYFRTSFYKSTSGWLLLNFFVPHKPCYSQRTKLLHIDKKTIRKLAKFPNKSKHEYIINFWNACLSIGVTEMWVLHWKPNILTFRLFAI